MNLPAFSEVIVQQRRELAEVFGFETRNKYEIFDSDKNLIGFCAEQQKGFIGFLMRQFLGHWRIFDVHFFDAYRKPVMIASHPFRFFFQEIEVQNAQGMTLGFIKQRWGIFQKKFDVQDPQGQLIFQMRSGFFSFWTFPFFNSADQECALVEKKWSGLLKEFFLDADNFRVHFKNPKMSERDRQLVLASAVFVDLQYFEKKANSNIDFG